MKPLDHALRPPPRSTRPARATTARPLLTRGVGIRFKGEEKTNVEEYCVSEGWVRLSLGAKVDRHGKALTIKLSGPVEPYLRDAD